MSATPQQLRRLIWTVLIVGSIVSISLVSLIIYVAGHFIARFW